MDREDRVILWKQLFGKPPHPALRREVMVPILAYRMQERAYGGLKPSGAKKLRAIVENGAHSNAPNGHSVVRAKPGTRFVREWNGNLHEVSVLNDGFEYKSQTYRSLSVIAREITGTRWSGPAFFGIKRRTRKADVD